MFYCKFYHSRYWQRSHRSLFPAIECFARRTDRLLSFSQIPSEQAILFEISAVCDNQNVVLRELQIVISNVAYMKLIRGLKVFQTIKKHHIFIINFAFVSHKS